jgi:cytochrome c oxidase subunit 4
MSDVSQKIDQIDARHGTSSPHPDPLRTYWLIFYWLMGLLVATVLAAQVNLDRLLPGLNLIVAMIIATAKGLLVVLFFMHVKQASKLTWLFASAAFVWLGILMFLSFNDYLLRDPIKPQVREHRAQTQEHQGRDMREPVSPRTE